MFLRWKTQTFPMHASEILIMLHARFLQQVSPGKGNVPSKSTCIVALSFAILSVCKENASSYNHPCIWCLCWDSFAFAFTVSTVYVFTGTGKLFLMCVKVE